MRRACGKSYIAVVFIILEGILVFMNLIENIFFFAGKSYRVYIGYSIAECVAGKFFGESFSAFFRVVFLKGI